MTTCYGIDDAIVEYAPRSEEHTDPTHYATLAFPGGEAIKVHYVPPMGHLSHPWWQVRGDHGRSVWERGDYREVVNRLLADYWKGFVS